MAKSSIEELIENTKLKENPKKIDLLENRILEIEENYLHMIFLMQNRLIHVFQDRKWVEENIKI